jgi:hypothetical protein
MLAAWLAARLRAFGRARHAGTEWVFTPVPSLPADLPRWHWGAVCLTWLWALGHHTYGVVLGWVPLLALSLEVGIWGIDPLRAATLPRLLTMLQLGAVATYACFLLMAMSGVRGYAWAWQSKTWPSVAHFHRVQQRWTTWGIGVLGLGLCLVALTGFLDRPPRMSNRPILAHLQWQGAPTTVPPSVNGFFVPAPDGTVVAVTSAQGLSGSRPPSQQAHWLDLRTQAPVATGAMRWGPLAHGLLLMPVEAVEAQGLANRVLALDTRVRPLAGEPVWLPMGDGAAEWGFQPVQGTLGGCPKKNQQAL